MENIKALEKYRKFRKECVELGLVVVDFDTLMAMSGSAYARYMKSMHISLEQERTKKGEMGAMYIGVGTTVRVKNQGSKNFHVVRMISDTVAEVVDVPAVPKKIQEIVSAMTNEVIEAHVEYQTHRVYVKDCTPLACDVFEIGDAVKRAKGRGNGFTGTVIGFAAETNGVICISDKIDKYDNDRTRWEYKVKELTKYEKSKTWKFEIGKEYKINNGDIVYRAAQYPNADGILLVGGQDGYFTKEVLPVELDRDDAYICHGIHNVQMLGGQR